MIVLEGLKRVEKAQWKDIQPGMIFLGGIRINDTVPFELRDFPVLTSSLLEDLAKKYCFLSRRDILVARVKTGYSPSKLSRDLKNARDIIDRTNTFRSAFIKEKENIIKKCRLPIVIDTPLLKTGYIEKPHLIMDRYNSISIQEQDTNYSIIPSLLHSLKSRVTLGHLLTGKIFSTFHLPRDKEILLHMVVDFGSSMEQKGKLDIVFSCLHFFHTVLGNLLTHTEIKLYVFSHECRPVHFPLTGKELPKRDRRYSSFIKKVLHFKDTKRHNKVILFTDHEPDDIQDTLHYGRLFKKNNIDYTQIIFSMDVHEDKGHLSMYSDFRRVTESCGGNQVIVNLYDIVPVVALECYDRYLGFLTMTDPFYRDFFIQKQDNMQNIKTGKIMIQNRGGKKVKGKQVKKWQPKIIRRRIKGG